MSSNPTAGTLRQRGGGGGTTCNNRSRMMAQIQAENKREATFKHQMASASHSSSTKFLQLYAILVLIVLLIGVAVLYVSFPRMFDHLSKVIMPPAPDRLRVVGFYPKGISPARQVPPIVGGMYAVCTPENLKTRQALNKIRSTQDALSVPHQQQVYWHVMERVDKEHVHHLKGWLQHTNCLNENDAEFLDLTVLHSLWQWCHLLMTSGGSTPTGLLDFDVATVSTTSLPRLHGKNFMVTVGEERRVSTSLLILRNPAPIASQVVEWIKEQQASKNTIVDDSSTTPFAERLEQYLYTLLVDGNGEEWLVGRMLCDDRLDDDAVVLARYHDCDIVLPHPRDENVKKSRQQQEATARRLSTPNDNDNNKERKDESGQVE